LSSQLAEILHKWPGGRIDLTSSGDIARLVLNRPEKSNCLSGEMMFHFGERVKVRKQRFNTAFCSNFYLSSPSLGSEMFRYMSSVLATIRSSSMVSVARLHGHCLGGATELASSCDIRVAHKETKIGFLQSRMGIVPSWGGAAYLESIIGRGAALRVMTTAPILTATEAKDIGFVDILYDTEETFEVAEHL
uniref:Ethylmalonyl-CoA decarboxylase n=1 Tax=Angiostrongylus cantonensis TaxID=6313 RepID=A0A0K0DB88_ANGCA